MFDNGENSNEIRVLHILPTLDIESGVASFAVNHQRVIRKYGINFDYVYHFSHGKNYLEECESMGSRVIRMPSFTLKDYNRIEREVRSAAFNNLRFDVVHCGQPNAAFLYAPNFYRQGVPFILHSHAAGATSDSRIKDIRNRILISYADHFVTDRFACSIAAGQSMFGKKEFYVAHNGIDGSKYAFSLDWRTKKRKELGLSNCYCIACVGRMAAQKNQAYLIPVLADVIKKQKDCRLVFVGTGVDEIKIREAVALSDVEDKVVFLGTRNDVNELYSAFDLLLMPSIYEGLPVAAIEAQFSGLNVLFSDTITQESSFLPNNEFISLRDKAEWVNQLVKRSQLPTDYDSRTRAHEFLNSYEIENTAEELSRAYKSIVSRLRKNED